MPETRAPRGPGSCRGPRVVPRVGKVSPVNDLAGHHIQDQSKQNPFTGRLTPAMVQTVPDRGRRFVAEAGPSADTGVQ